MHPIVTSNNENWYRYIWPTVFVFCQLL